MDSVCLKCRGFNFKIDHPHCASFDSYQTQGRKADYPVNRKCGNWSAHSPESVDSVVKLPVQNPGAYDGLALP